jgi:hypothetical protein
MTGNLALFQKNNTKVSEGVDRFLKDMKNGSASGRLIFALDVTASRKPTWDLASSLQAQMFQEVASIGGLSLQLVYYRGFGECKASEWITNSALLLRKMSAIDCLGGTTQIGRVLAHAKAETAKQKVAAMVFVGDAVEEDPDTLIAKARELELPTFMFQEGVDPLAHSTFQGIAGATGGAYAHFDASSAKRLAELLKAVALFATGGLAALEHKKDAATTLLLGQLKGGV